MSKQPMLPQHDPNPEDRLKWIAENREKYDYDHDYLPPMPVIKSLPRQEYPSKRYIAERLPLFFQYRANDQLTKFKHIFDPFNELADFEALLPLLPKPMSMDTWRTDAAFAEQRLSGANPMKIKRVTHLSQVPFKLGRLPNFQQSIEDAIQAGQLYITDYGELSFVQGGTSYGRRKYLPAPTALFYWTSGHRDRLNGSGQLIPLAIQIKRGGPIYTPHTVSPMDWMLAKMCVQIADAHHHQLSSHLCHTHLVMEPFAIAAGRQFAENHPLGILLRQHFRFLLMINTVGRKTLLKPGAAIELVLAGTREESLKVVTNAYEEWNIKEYAFPTEVKNRGLDDTNLLPHFPYRDDGILLWQAISRFVRDYVNLYYKEEVDVQQDRELQAWADEVACASKGRVKNMPSQIENRTQLIELLTNLIFICGPQHGAVNFSQYDYMAFVPNMPAAAYCPVPGQNELLTEQQLLDFLPPEEAAREQVVLIRRLGSYHYDRLGFYEEDAFTDLAAQQIVEQFQHNLAEIEKVINGRNTSRPVNYKFMKPSEILNSISV